MTNVPLETAMRAKGLTPEALGEACGVDPKSVERWIRDDRVPRVDNRWSVARVLGVEPSYLWPSPDDEPASHGPAEFVAHYAHRGLVPHRLWTSIVERPTTAISVLVYAGMPWFETNPEVLDVLRRRADEGAAIRLAFGDPDCNAVALRGVEEGIDMAARVRNTLKVIEPLVGYPGISIRLHSTTLYVSLYMTDDELLANHHILGVPAPQAPVLHLRRVPGGYEFTRYARSFERAWSEARDYE